MSITHWTVAHVIRAHIFDKTVVLDVVGQINKMMVLRKILWADDHIFCHPKPLRIQNRFAQDLLFVHSVILTQNA